MTNTIQEVIKFTVVTCDLLSQKAISSLFYRANLMNMGHAFQVFYTDKRSIFCIWDPSQVAG